MNKIKLSLILLFLINCAAAQVKQTVVRSTIAFEIKNMGFNTRGSISGLQGNIQFDPANLNSSSIEASVDVKTINTDNDMRDEHLKSDTYFDAVKYPTITIRSVVFKHKSGDSYTGEFNLTIKSITKLVQIPFTYSAQGNTAAFKGSFKMKRSDFGIGSGSMVLSDDVTVTIDAETSK